MRWIPVMALAVLAGCGQSPQTPIDPSLKTAVFEVKGMT